MSDQRDAYVVVEVELPNGTIASGRPIPWGTARDLIVLHDAFMRGGEPKDTLLPLLQGFQTATGITEEYLLGCCPDLTLGELTDFISRFFYHRRPARIAGTSGPAPAPAAVAGT